MQHQFISWSQEKKKKSRDVGEQCRVYIYTTATAESNKETGISAPKIKD